MSKTVISKNSQVLRPQTIRFEFVPTLLKTIFQIVERENPLNQNTLVWSQRVLMKLPLGEVPYISRFVDVGDDDVMLTPLPNRSSSLLRRRRLT
jgi:hypothetical protein